MRRIVLASASPRRKELLRQIGLRFEVGPVGIDEEAASAAGPEDLARGLSLGKARAAARTHPDAIIIAADTLVVMGGRVFGQPRTDARARQMLRALHGRTHSVITGFTVLDTGSGRAVTRSVETRVHLRKLAPGEIDAYVATGEPLDKAGGYAIQGRGAVIVDRIEGDYSNVVGLPLAALAQVLGEVGITVLQAASSPRRGTGLAKTRGAPRLRRPPSR